MSAIQKVRYTEVTAEHKNEHEGFEYFKHPLVPKGAAKQCAVSVYEIPPGKTAYPYHSHTMNEESFYILQGKGVVRTPNGVLEVAPGDFLFFPADESGAHLITNPSETETLVYIDFDTENSIDVAFYPDSGKIGVWGQNTNMVFRVADRAGYYEGE